MRARAAALCACALALLAPDAAAAEGWVPVPGPSGSGTLFRVPVKSMQALRFENVVQQQYDLSCGAAALATLLTYFYDDPRTEREIIDAAVEIGDIEQINKLGFSMLELKRYAESAGYVVDARSFETLDRAKRLEILERVRIPLLVLVSVRGYMHFVVMKSVSDGKVYIADPAFGNRVSDLESFDRDWNQIVMAVMSATNAGDPDFAEHAALEGRLEEVPLLTDYGLRPIPPSPGSFR